MRADRIILVVLLLAGFAGRAAAQGVIAGRVLSTAQEPLAGASVALLRATDSVVIRVIGTNAVGAFRFASVPSGEYLVRVQRLGYEVGLSAVRLGRDATAALELVLREQPIPFAPLPVETERARARFESQAGLTARELSRSDLRHIPGLAEPDVLRAIETLPGVVATTDLSSAFNVRGGSADQNLILLDGVPIYNPFHLGGLFSVFNADMVDRAELLTGGFPAQYGSRVSSVLNVHSDAGEAGQHVHGGVSLLAGRVAVGAKMPSGWARRTGLEAGRARVGVRRSYFDQLLKPVLDFPYHLTDLQGVIDAWTDGGARLGITVYVGEDVLDLVGLRSFPLQVKWDWGNAVAGARWQQPLPRGGALAVRASWSRFYTGMSFPDFADQRFRSRVEHGLLRADFEVPRGRAVWSTGLELHRLSYANLLAAGGTAFGQSDGRGWQSAAYLQASIRPTHRWVLEAGLRADGWWTDSRNTIVAAPRLAAKHLFSGDLAAKLALGRYTQFVHSLRDEELPLSLDVWVLAGARAPHISSDQVQAGLEWFRGDWYGALEGYVRRFDGVITNNFADDPNLPNDDLLAGAGAAYGGDLVVRRERGAVRGFATLSLLRATREFPDALSGEVQPAVIRYAPIFDRRLEFDAVLRFSLPLGFESGVRWNYGTGLPYTRALASYSLYEYGVQDGRRFENDHDLTAVLLAERNADRYPAYHRLDLSVRKTLGARWGTVTPHLDILNVYNRRNVLFYFYQYGRDPAVRNGLSTFPFLPTLGVQVVF